MNAKEELINNLKKYYNSVILCADITYEPEYNKEIHIRLPLGYTQKELLEFLNKLDVDYDNGYGYQQLYGYVWLNESAWLERGEYDGSEWWDYKECPLIPEYLKNHRDHWELV